MPAISVLIPIYNSAQFLGATLDSLLAQTFAEWEALLVLDTKSKDDSAKVAAEYASRDPRFRVLQGPQPGGVSVNRNFGIHSAHGRYLAFLDSDDLWRPRKLQTQLQFMKAQEIAFSFHSTQFISEDGLTHGREHIVPLKVTRGDLLKTNVIGCSSVILDKQAFRKIEFPLQWHEDLRLWLSLLGEVPYAHGNPEVLSDYRVRQNQLSGSKKKAAFHRWEIICENEPNWLRRVTSFGIYAASGLAKHRGNFKTS